MSALNAWLKKYGGTQAPSSDNNQENQQNGLAAWLEKYKNFTPSGADTIQPPAVEQTDIYKSQNAAHLSSGLSRDDFDTAVRNNNQLKEFEKTKAQDINSKISSHMVMTKSRDLPLLEEINNISPFTKGETLTFEDKDKGQSSITIPYFDYEDNKPNTVIQAEQYLASTGYTLEKLQSNIESGADKIKDHESMISQYATDLEVLADQVQKNPTIANYTAYNTLYAKYQKAYEEYESLITDHNTKIGLYNDYANKYETVATDVVKYNNQWESANQDFFKKSQSGLSAFYDEKNAQQQSHNEEESEKSWFRKLMDANAKSYNITNDNPAVYSMNAVVENYKNDTSYKEPSDKWTDGQKNIFGYLWAVDQEKADEFAVMVNDSINKERSDKTKKKIANWCTKNFGTGLGGTIAALALAPTAIADATDNLTEYVARGRITEKGTLSPFDLSQAITGGISEELNDMFGTIDDSVPVVGGKGVGDLYQLGYSMAQSISAGKISQLAGNSAFTLAMFFGQGTASGIDKQLDVGGTAEQALGYGLVVGAAEAVAETMGIESLFKSGNGNLLKQILKQSGVEALEEGLTSIIDFTADTLIMMDKSDVFRAIDEYSKVMSPDKAKTAALLDILEGIAFDAMGGFMTGGIDTTLIGGANKVGQATDLERQKKKQNQIIKNADAVIKAYSETVQKYGKESAQATELKKKYEVAYVERVRANNRLGVLYKLSTEVSTQERSEDEITKLVEKAQAVGDVTAETGYYTGASDSLIKAAADVKSNIKKVSGRDVDIRFYQGDSSENGYYSEGRIYVNVNSNQSFSFIYGHEFTHDLETNGGYAEYAAWVKNEGLGAAYETYKANIESRYANRGISLSPEALEQEVVATWTGENLFADDATIKKLMKNLSDSNPSLMKRLFGKIKEAVVRPRDTVTRNHYEKALYLYQQMMKGQTVQSASQTNTTPTSFTKETAKAAQKQKNTAEAVNTAENDIMISKGEAAQTDGKFTNDSEFSAKDNSEPSEYGGIEESKANLQAQFEAGNITREQYEEGMAELEEVGAEDNSQGRIKYSLYLSNEDVPDYLKAGNRQNKNRQARFESGQKIIISTDEEFESFVKNSVLGTNETAMVAYGKVDDRLAKQVEKLSNSKIDIKNAYLELLNNDIYHAFKEHQNPKEQGDLDMSVDDLIYALKNVNQSIVVGTKQYKDGGQRVTLAIPTKDGTMMLVEIASKSAGSLRLKTGWKTTTEKFEQKYRSSISTTGSESSTNAVRENTASTDIVSHPEENVNRKFSFEDLDNEYLDAVNSGDMETANRLVEEAAKKAGYTDKVYHGTQEFGFTEFDANHSDDKISFFAAGSPDLAQTYSGRYGDKNISDIKSANDLSIEDVVKRLSEEAKENYLDRQLESEYRIMTLQDINDLVNEVKSGIDELQEIVKHKIKVYADKMALDFNDTDAKIHSQLVELYGILQKNQYERMSTPIYVLLHQTNAFDGNSEIADLESKIRLMNELSRVNTNDGVIVAKQLGGYSYDIFSFDEARKQLQDRLSYGNYALFGKPGNQLVIDGRGQIWNDIRYWSKALKKTKDDTYVKKEDGYYTLYDKDTDKEIAGGKFAVNSYTERLGLSQLHYVLVDNVNNMLSIQTESINSTRDIVRYAKKLGYDSVKFENIKDNGGRGEDVGAGDVYAYFNPNDLKSADTVTYDEDGNVVPLSERFNSEETDIRYSLEAPTKDDVINELKQYMNGARSKEQIRDIIARTKKNPESEIYGGKSKHPKYSEGMQRILRDAFNSGMSVRDYIGQNYDSFEVDGRLSNDALAALDFAGEGRKYSIEERQEYKKNTSGKIRSIAELDKLVAEMEPIEREEPGKNAFDRWYERTEREDQLREKMAELVMKAPDENEINTTLEELASDLENGYITPNAALEVVEGLRAETDGARVKYSLNENAKENLHRALYDTKHRSEVLLRDDSPAIMTSQKGVKNLPMVMNASHIRENVFTEEEAKQLGLQVNEHTHYHGLGEKFFLMVIDGLDNVKEAYRGTKTAEDASRRENYFLLVSEFTDKEGNTINVPVYINEHAQYNRVFVDVNKISTVFGRDSFRDYINRQLRKNNLVKIKNRSTQASEGSALIAEAYGMNTSVYDSISPVPENVNKKNKKSLEDIDVPEADTVETLQAELEKATSERDAIMAEAEKLMAEVNQGSVSLEDYTAQIAESGQRYEELQNKIDRLTQQIESIEIAEKVIGDPLKSKPLKKFVTTLGERLNLKKVEKSALTRLIQSVATGEYATKEELYEAVKEGFNTVYYTERNDLIAKIKATIRDMPIKVSDTIKFDAGWTSDGYGNFVKSNFGKLRFSSSGRGVDSVYSELNSLYPDYFPEDIINPSDQLQQISKVASQPINRVRAEPLDDGAMQDITDFIYESVLEYRESERADEERVRIKNEQEAIEAQQRLTSLQNKALRFENRFKLTEEDKALALEILCGDKSISEIDNVSNKEQLLEYIAVLNEAEVVAKGWKKWQNERRSRWQKEADEMFKTFDSSVKGGFKYDKKGNIKTDRKGDAKFKSEASNKAGFRYERETQERITYDIFAKDKSNEARAFNDWLFAPERASEAESNRYKNRMRDEVRKLGLDENIRKGNTVSESAAVQLLGELQDIIRRTKRQADLGNADTYRVNGLTYNEAVAAINDLKIQNKSLDFSENGKIQNAIEVFGKLYAELLSDMNTTLVRNGYPPVPARSGYFPHFAEEGDSLIQRIGRALGIDTDVSVLPTDINGLTHTFKPGKTWFSNALERKGNKTAYDAVLGFDKYIEGAANVIFHTDNIQRQRYFARAIRYNASDAAIKAKIDSIIADDSLDEEGKDLQIQVITSRGKFRHSTYVVQLEDHTNSLAGKKSFADRDMERKLGRKAYTWMRNVESRNAANLIAGNMSSAFSNYIPLVFCNAEIGEIYTLQAMAETIGATFKNDGFVDRSDFLTNRYGSDHLTKNRGISNAISNKLSVPMEAIDHFTSQVLVRAAYNKYTKKGVSPDLAMKRANEWTAGVMADRSRGALPEVFNSRNPIYKAFTMFQVETNNVLSHIMKDIPRENQDEWAGKVLFILAKLFFGIWLFNEGSEKLAGRRMSGLDVIDSTNEFVGDISGHKLPNTWDLIEAIIKGENIGDLFETNKSGLGDAILNLGETAAEDVPFVGSLFGGGDLPVGTAMPNLSELLPLIGSDKDPKSIKQTLSDELLKPVTYTVLPFGANQLQKIYKGHTALREGGSYKTNSAGEEILQYPIYAENGGEAVWNFLQATVFGKSALSSAREWVDNDFNSLSARGTAAYKAMIAVGVTETDAYNLITELASATTSNKETEEKSYSYESADRTFTESTGESSTDVKYEILRNSNISGEGKAVVFFSMLASKTECKLMISLHESGANMAAVTEELLDKSLSASDRKYAAITASGLSDKEQLNQIYDLETSSGKSTYKKYRAASEAFDISPSEYRLASAYVTDYLNGASITNARVEAAIKEYAKDVYLTTNDKAALWQIITGSTSAKNNPFNVSAGERALKAMG